MMPCRSSKDVAVWRPHHSLHLPAVEVSPVEDLQLPPVVARHPVLAAPVHVDGGQVHPELLAGLLEQEVYGSTTSPIALDLPCSGFEKD